MKQHNNAETIHILSRELIFIYEDLGEEAKEIVDTHMRNCNKCRELHLQSGDLDGYLQDDKVEMEEEYNGFKSFTKLNWIKGLVLVTFSLIKLIILVLIGREFWNLQAFTEAPLGLLDEGVRINMIFYYLPAVIISQATTFFFVRKRWIAIFIIIDFLALFYFDNLLVSLVS